MNADGFSAPSRRGLFSRVAVMNALCALILVLCGCGEREDIHSEAARVSEGEQSKPTDGAAAAEEVVVTDEETQWPVKIDWDSLRYETNLLGDKSPYRFWTSDNYPIYLWLRLPRRVDDDAPPKEVLILDIGGLPGVDLKQRPDLQQNLVKAVDRLTQEAKTDKVRNRLAYLKKEVLRRSKTPNFERPGELVIRKEDPKKLVLVKQLLQRIDWKALKYKDRDLGELVDGGFIYAFETPDHYSISVYLSGQTDDMEPEEKLGLGIDPPKIDLTQSPNLLQRVVTAVDRATQEADIEWRKDELKQLKQEILRRSKLKAVER